MTRNYALTSLLILPCSLGMIHAAPVLRTIPQQEVQAIFPQQAPPHPRLLMSEQQLAAVKAKIQSQPALDGFYQALLRKADAIIKQEPVTRVKTGRRLLGVSRLCLDRVLALGMAYRLSDKRAYLKRAETEMLAAAAFTDWNPSHFLDVAEMTAALALGYDWLYPDLPASSRREIKQAILDKGLHPSFKVTHWVNGHNNWNQVCNGGITLGALALMEDEPELALRIVHRAVNGVQAVMAQYEPDGAYPEGPGYWVYGTSYNCLLLAALDSVLGTDFGLAQAPGFSRSAAYYLNVTGPAGLYFNYPDSGSRDGFICTVFWFAQKYNQPYLAWTQHQLWQRALQQKPGDLLIDRLSPLTLLWATDKPAVPEHLSWMGRGSNGVAMFRTSWIDPNAVYMAIKGGSPGVSHGHMDVGSFVVDADGLRWAGDLGPESYDKIESRGMNLWGQAQDAERWTIFRYNNTSHNTLVVNDQHQRVKGQAPIIRYSALKEFPHTVFDLSAVYEGQLAQALRGAALLPTGQIVIQDELTAPDHPTSVRWAMVTSAEVELRSDRTALLKQKGKTLGLAVVGDIEMRWTTFSTEPKADYDASNPGTRMVGFAFELTPGRIVRYAVTLSPSGTARPSLETLKPLRAWSAALPTPHN